MAERPWLWVSSKGYLNSTLCKASFEQNDNNEIIRGYIPYLIDALQLYWAVLLLISNI